MSEINYEKTDFHKTLDKILDGFKFQESMVYSEQNVVRHTRKNKTSNGSEVSVYSNSPCENTRREQAVFLYAENPRYAALVRMQDNVITVGYFLDGRKDFSERIDFTRINETSQNLENFGVEKKMGQLFKAYFEKAREFIQKGDFSDEACKVYLDAKPIYNGIFDDIEGVFRIKRLFEDMDLSGEKQPADQVPITHEEAIADTANEIPALDPNQPYQSSLDGEEPSNDGTEAPKTKRRGLIDWLVGK